MHSYILHCAGARCGSQDEGLLEEVREIQTESCNDYSNSLQVYLNTMDTLLGMSSNLCYWTKEGSYANFRVSAFKTVLRQKGRGENYRYYLNHFRTFSWIVCSEEKFSNPQRVKGELTRVITVNYKKYLLLKRLLEEDTYFLFLQRFITATDQILIQNEKTDKCLCVCAKDGQILNVKNSDYRILLKGKCGSMEEYQNSLEVFRSFEWIVCRLDSFTNIQKINGKAMRVVSIDYEKYRLTKELYKSR